MNTVSKKITSLSLTALLSVFGLTAATAPARAADCLYPVTDPTSNDHPKYNIRLVSPTLDDSNAIRRYSFEGSWTLDCDWFGVGMRFFSVYVPYGQDATLTYNVTNASNVKMANTKVKLRLNKQYSGSNAPIIVNDVAPRMGTATNDGGYVFGTTDVNGNVSFLVKSPDKVKYPDCEKFGGSLPAEPKHFDDDPPFFATNDATTDCFSQLLPEITTEKTDSQDFLEIHYYNPSTTPSEVTEAKIKLLTPLLDDSNSIQDAGNVQTYSAVGSTQIVAFQALTANDAWIRNTPVRVRVNLAGSSADAKVSAGIFGNVRNGASTTLTNADSTKTSDDQLVLTGTTDAFGTVTFQLKNNDTVGEPVPTSNTAPVPTTGAKFTKVIAELTGKTNTGSSLEIHYFKPVPPTSITITAVGRKINVVINNAIGKSSTVTITGLKKATVKPTKAAQTYSYTVTKGAKTVTVIANGKTVTKKLTIK